MLEYFVVHEIDKFSIFCSNAHRHVLLCQTSGYSSGRYNLESLTSLALRAS